MTDEQLIEKLSSSYSNLKDRLIHVKRVLAQLRKDNAFLQERLDNENAELMEQNEALEKEVLRLTNLIKGAEALKTRRSGWINDKIHKKVCEQKAEWEKRYWELHKKTSANH